MSFLDTLVNIPLSLIKLVFSVLQFILIKHWIITLALAGVGFYLYKKYWGKI